MAHCSNADLRCPSAANIVKLLNTYSWLVDMCIADFFTERHWDKLPHCWQRSLSGCNLKKLCLLLFSTHHTSTVWPLSLLAFAKCCRVLSVPRQATTSHSSSAGESVPLGTDHHKHVKAKKQHEIKCLGKVIHKLADEQNCSNVIDVGSGHGHLARHLAYDHQLNVTTVESDESHFKLAVKFDSEMKQDLEKKVRKGIDVKTTGTLKHITHHIKPNICDKEVAELLDHCAAMDVASGSMGGASQPMLLVGLHTCGDLGPTMLHMFTASPHITGLVSVGCCYMKLTCASATEPHPPTPIGYPLSSLIRSLDGYVLSYEARELACHAQELYSSRVLSDSEPLRIHCYRAVVQTILIQHGLHRSQLVVPKKTSKLPFKEYAEAILASFHLPIDLDMISLQPLLDRWKDVVVVFMLRLAIAPSIESIILLDRLLYLKEHGCSAILLPLFDPSVSPRNLIITAHK